MTDYSHHTPRLVTHAESVEALAAEWPEQRPVSIEEASDSATKLAELILSDCGHSTAITTALRDRVALRIDKYTDALAALRSMPAEPVARVNNEGFIVEVGDLLLSPGMELFATPPPAPVLSDAWQPIETAPKDGRTMLLGHFNALGNWRTMRGQWMSAEYIEENWEDPDNGEEGWFETAVEPDDVPNCWATEPSHWQPLPPPPIEQAIGRASRGAK